MGGKVAQLAASRRPAGLAGLILVAPATPSPTHLPEAMVEQQLHAYDSPESVMQTIRFLSAQPLHEKAIEQIIEDSMSGHPEARRAWPLSAIREDIATEVGKINVPTVLLAGEKDNLDSIEQHKKEVLSRIPGARLRVVAQSGHLSPIEQPVTIADEIASFVRDLPDQGSS